MPKLKITAKDLKGFEKAESILKQIHDKNFLELFYSVEQDSGLGFVAMGNQIANNAKINVPKCVSIHRVELATNSTYDKDGEKFSYVLKLYGSIHLDEGKEDSKTEVTFKIGLPTPEYEMMFKQF
jgi:hypothetical protein